jgi:hypothetical protein
MEQFVPLPVKAEFSCEESEHISSYRLVQTEPPNTYDCVMLREHSLILPELWQRNKGDILERIAA